MKTRSNYVIFAENTGWTVIAGAGTSAVNEVAIPAQASPEETATAAAHALREIAPAGAAVTLAISSRWCLCAAIDTTGLPRQSRRQAMLFRLEEQLPLAAEEFVADFLVTDDARSLGIVAQLRLVNPAVRAIEAAGFVVQTICPAALLAAQVYLASPDFPACDALLFGYADHLELLLLSEGRLTEWDVLPCDPGDVAMELGVRSLQHSPPLRLACANVPEDVLSRLRELVQLQVQDVQLPPTQQAAIQAACSIAEGESAPWVQLRRDALGNASAYGPARRAINAALAASIFFCICLCGALLWRASAYERVVAQHQRDQTELFAHIFDGKHPAEGINISSRLASEERRFRALAGESMDLPSRPSALVLLQRVLARLPADADCQITELRLNQEKLYLSGIASSHTAAATFASNLAADSTFHIDPPRTEQLPSDGGIALTLTGTATAAPTTRQVQP